MNGLHCRKRVYIAHQYSGTDAEQDQNRRNAAKWCAWAVTQGVAPTADWIILTGELAETPENRLIGLDVDCSLIRGCDEVWLVGPRISSGMLIEANFARGEGIPVIDRTGPVLPPGVDREADTLIPSAPDEWGPDPFGHRPPALTLVPCESCGTPIEPSVGDAAVCMPCRESGKVPDIGLDDPLRDPPNLPTRRCPYVTDDGRECLVMAGHEGGHRLGRFVAKGGVAR